MMIFFSAPDFVNALEDEEHVYFFFREAAVEHINCGKVSDLEWASISKNKQLEKTFRVTQQVFDTSELKMTKK